MTIINNSATINFIGNLANHAKTMQQKVTEMRDLSDKLFKKVERKTGI